jgi:hypothetical protein
MCEVLLVRLGCGYRNSVIYIPIIEDYDGFAAGGWLNAPMPH